MCGRYSLTLPPEAVRSWFAFRGQPNLAPRYNIAPTQDVPIIRPGIGEHGGTPEMVMARWGLVPGWSKEIGTKPLINARSEGVRERASFKGAFAARRCLVPADGFYEWQAHDGAPKTPYRICRHDRGPFAMAGIFELWKTPEGRWLLSMAIMTTDANATLKPIHDRMPVILGDADRELWLAQESELGELGKLLRPAPDDLLVAYTISTRVNKVDNDDEELWRPAPPQSPAQLSLL